MKILIKHKHRSNIINTVTCMAGSLLILMGSLSAPLANANNQPQLLDQVIAIVDDDVVMASELRDRIQQVKLNIEKSGKTAPPMDEIQRQILDQLILENIQLQMAYRAGVRISDAQLNDSMLRIAQQNRMDLIQFKEALERDGVSYNETREQIRKEMLLQRVQQGNVNQRVQITDQEIANFLSSKEGQAMTAPEYRMLHTLIAIPSGADKATIASAKKMADTLYQRIENGEDYAKVISNYSQLKINDLGWRKAADLPSLISGLATTTGEGDTASPVQSASGFHLVKLLDKRGDGKMIPQTKARHILLKPSAIRNEAATEAEIKALRQRTIDGESFEELAREFSEDIGSALEGGDLGWTSPGQLVGAFQDAMDSTKPNDISPAFKSQYGWHILQVIERRDKDVTDDIRRNIARNHIHQRKYDDELQTWLQKIRDEAYVDFK
ncbi:MAG: molecular chaperone SurA [Oceanicoccus sp.]|uniref:peptidylprolyl isomerase n=1 Tax=Oceanicoccus sp. TaxID=2691044 RepID=UPI00260A4BE0|nr:peptidylprolyl isomerase [Oceanicoccus sp.]MCP3906575.1 molecular chaperone SurA [Oceanicoccus sp.]MDG1772362.1 peptidylprolyl isomerase [Oceanicoccus sp.]